MASYQYIYVMQNLSKVFPGGKELFKNQFRICLCILCLSVFPFLYKLPVSLCPHFQNMRKDPFQLFLRLIQFLFIRQNNTDIILADTVFVRFQNLFQSSPDHAYLP